MAERRMFAKTIIDSDAFIEMPMSARLLYYDLGMRADDDGFVNAPKKIMRMTGCSDDDMKILIAKKFIIPFETGIVVIKHWRINNYLRSDRYTETKYLEEKAMLECDENGSYRQREIVTGIPSGRQLVGDMDTQDRLGKDRLGKDSIDNSGASPQKNFKPPTLEDVQAYCKERNKGVDADRWYDFYISKGWMIGKNKMKDWKAAVRTWEKGDTSKGQATKKTVNFEGRKYEANHGEKFIEQPVAIIEDDEIERIKEQRRKERELKAQEV